MKFIEVFCYYEFKWRKLEDKALLMYIVAVSSTDIVNVLINNHKEIRSI